MVDTALLWIGLVGAVAVASLRQAVERSRADERPLYALALAAAAFGGVFELAEANGYLGAATSEPLTWAALLVAVGLIAVALRERWRAWGA